MAIIATTALGWSVHRPQLSGASRPGPHQANASNPREIIFRDADVADLHAAVMWLIHTGNGGRLPDVPVRLWHGSRPLDATFGSQRSDHKAEVASDINWDLHLWEEATGRVRYERTDLHNPALTSQHALFAAVEDRLAVSGKPVIRWCGIAWLNRRGWGYPIGHRDCMHWVVEEPDTARIKAAVKALHAWFVPPRTTSDVRDWQARVGVVPDGQWGPLSVASMRTHQRRLGVYPTGLPGDLATWRAWKTTNPPTPTEELTVSDIKTLLARLDALEDLIERVPREVWQRTTRRPGSDTPVTYDTIARYSAHTSQVRDIHNRIDQLDARMDTLATGLTATPTKEK